MFSSDTPTITLRWLKRSCAQRILWLLEEINVPYEIKMYKRHPKTQFALPKLKAIHPLGKSPVVTINNLAMAKSALVVKYLSEHFSPSLILTKWKAGCEGKASGETKEYMRYRYFMHYCEGSLLPLLLVSILSDNIRTAPVPFFICPVTSRISGSVKTEFLNPNFDTY